MLVAVSETYGMLTEHHYLGPTKTALFAWRDQFGCIVTLPAVFKNEAGSRSTMSVMCASPLDVQTVFSSRSLLFREVDASALHWPWRSSSRSEASSRSAVCHRQRSLGCCRAGRAPDSCQ